MQAPLPPDPAAAAAAAADHQETTLAQLTFALAERTSPAVVFCDCASAAKRRAVEEELTRRLPANRFHTLDVTPYAVVSLLRTLGEHLPEDVRTAAPGTAIVHVHGLENSLLVSRGGQLLPSAMTQQLNMERELLYRRVPYSIVLWGDHRFFATLQREAPDLCHWVTYQFRFEDADAVAVEELPPLPRERVEGRGDIAARRARIVELETRRDRLQLNDADTNRLRRELLNIESLLGAEYREAFEFEKAVEAYRKAIRLAESGAAPADTRGRLWYELGEAYRLRRCFPEAISALETSWALGTEQNYGVIAHRIGLVYQKQRNWAAALDNYQKALYWFEKKGDTVGQCRAYHQIGRVNEQQQQWAAALDNYQRSLQLHEQSGNSLKVGVTYQQIGHVYAHQQRWEEAIDNYLRAIQLEKQTDDTFQLGSTYHELGRAYQQQKQWSAALENFQQALHWYEQTGNVYELGVTYGVIGQVYEQQGDLLAAVNWYEKSITNLRQHTHSLLPIAEESLARVRAALQSPPSANEPPALSEKN